MTEFDYSKNQIISYIQHRLRDERQGYNIVFTGSTGSGKSYACMDFCKLVDPEFDMTKVAWSERDFLELLRKEMPPGSAIMLDEAGIYMDSREFMSMINKLITYVTMTMRHRRQLVALTVPSMKWIDLKTRELIQGYVEMVKPGLGRMFMLQTNYRYGKTYFHSSRVASDNGPLLIDSFKFENLPNEVSEEYEAKKMSFTRDLIDDVITKVDMAKRRVNRVEYSDMDVVNYVKDHKGEFKTYGKIDVMKVAIKFDLTDYRRKEIQRKLRASGIINKRQGMSVRG